MVRKSVERKHVNLKNALKQKRCLKTLTVANINLIKTRKESSTKNEDGGKVINYVNLIQRSYEKQNTVTNITVRKFATALKSIKIINHLLSCDKFQSNHKKKRKEGRVTVIILLY